MIVQARSILLFANSFLLLLSAAIFISNHGGIIGDADIIDTENDVVSRPEDIGNLMLNRWKLTPDSESPLVKAYLYVNVIPLMISRQVFEVIGGYTCEFQKGYPFGLSYPSYTFMLSVPISLIFWYTLGMLIDWLIRWKTVSVRCDRLDTSGSLRRRTKRDRKM